MLVPTHFVDSLPDAIAFYGGILGFEIASVIQPDDPFYAVLMYGADELHLSLAPPGRRCGTTATVVVCEDVDGLFATFKARGLAGFDRTDSPVHAGPVDQTWGTREVYVDDPSGNTLIFQQR
jgi:catechol 2,3-dioxygenase-like lactoylglutathione lyase family enzyme